jgi:hypothetical protein
LNFYWAGLLDGTNEFIEKFLGLGVSSHQFLQLGAITSNKKSWVVAFLLMDKVKQ